MRVGILFPVVLLLASSPSFAQDPASKATAEVKVGLGIAKWELTGAAESFKVAPGTKLYAWTRVRGVKDAITIVFAKGGKTVFQQKLEVKSSPYRTNAYHTFRAGEAGAWTAKVLAPDGTELGSASFTVEIS
jgi:hypothetical protein